MRMAKGLASLLTVLLLCATAWSSNDAAPPAVEQQLVPNRANVQRNASNSAKPRRPAHPIAEDREAEAIAFVEQHHSELARLLAHLKKRDTASYDQAIRQLYRDSRRLMESSERDSLRHTWELRKWRAESRIQLISARLSMGEDEKLRAELTRELRARHDARTALVELERDRAEQRAERLTEALRKLEANREKAIERELERLLQNRTP